MKSLFVLIFLINGYFCSAQKSKYPIYNYSELGQFNADTIFALSIKKIRQDSLEKILIEFKNLKFLDISNNKLTKLPQNLSELESLEVLDFSKNKIEVFPIQICSLNQLKELYASRNYFERIPECIGFCTQLEHLDFWSTPIGHFPTSIINLKNLKTLDLEGIKFSPDFQKKLKEQLPQVKILMDPPCDCMN